MVDSIYKWSRTAASNDAADSLVNWRENQLPDTINDSARAMMMRIAEWRDDMTGAGLVTAGTQPAYTLTTASAFDTLIDGRMVMTRVHATNTGVATLNANGTGAKSIRKYGTTGDAPISSGDLQLGGVYQFVYQTAANGGAGGWVLTSAPAGAISGFPTGTSMLFMQAAAPVGWTKATTHDNKALRIVSGAGGGSGGTTSFSAVFSSRTPTGSNTGTALTLAQLPSHTHTQTGSFNSGGQSAGHTHNVAGGTDGGTSSHQHNIPIWGGTSGRTDGCGGNGFATVVDNKLTDSGGFHGHNFNVTSGGYVGDHVHTTTISGETVAAGSGATHTHPFVGAAMDFAVQYVDAIICTKD